MYLFHPFYRVCFQPINTLGLEKHWPNPVQFIVSSMQRWRIGFLSWLKSHPIRLIPDPGLINHGSQVLNFKMLSIFSRNKWGPRFVGLGNSKLILYSFVGRPWKGPSMMQWQRTRLVPFCLSKSVYPPQTLTVNNPRYPRYSAILQDTHSNMLRSLMPKRPLADAHRTTSLFWGRVVRVRVCCHGSGCGEGERVSNSSCKKSTQSKKNHQK